MKLQQLIVDSPSLTDHSQNELIARSTNIKPEVLEAAVKLSTVGGGMLDGQSSTTFYCRYRSGTGMVGRSYVSGFDSLGKRSMRTHWVLVSSIQMKSYFNNAVLIARTLNSSGAWMLQTSAVQESLPELEITDNPVNSFAYPDQQQQVESALRAVKIHERIALTETRRPLDFVGQVLQSLSFKERVKMNFAIDRRVGQETPFQINAYSKGDIRLEHDLNQHGIYPVRLRSEQALSR